MEEMERRRRRIKFFEKKNHCLSFRSPFVSRCGPITILLDSNPAVLPFRLLLLASQTPFPRSLRKAGTFGAPQWSFTRAIGEKPARLPTLPVLAATASRQRKPASNLSSKKAIKQTRSTIMGEKMFSISAANRRSGDNRLRIKQRISRGGNFLQRPAV